MRITIVSRIFAPEPSAGSLVLNVLARTFTEAGHKVTVLTVRPPKGIEAVDPPGVKVKRARVLRDRQGYVRGYLPYLSFDLPLLFRLLFRRRADAYFVEPPPTTGAVVRMVTGILRRPYFYRVADIWTDGARIATDSKTVVSLLRVTERFALRGADHLFAPSQGVVDRMRQLGVHTPATVTGAGVDTRTFSYQPPDESESSPYFVYAGTHSEWQGAGIFVEAFARFTERRPGFRLLFIGNGSERDMLTARAKALGLDNVEFRNAVVPTRLTPVLAGATASLVSIRPGQGYDYAFPSKVFSSLAVGCPIIYAGVGPTVDFIDSLRDGHSVGEAVAYEPDTVADAFVRLADDPPSPDCRREMAEWTAFRHSLDSIAESILRTMARPHDGKDLP